MILKEEEIATSFTLEQSNLMHLFCSISFFMQLILVIFCGFREIDVQICVTVHFVTAGFLKIFALKILRFVAFLYCVYCHMYSFLSFFFSFSSLSIFSLLFTIRLIILSSINYAGDVFYDINWFNGEKRDPFCDDMLTVLKDTK